MSGHFRVLLIEDCQDVALLVSDELQRHGHKPELLRVETVAALEGALSEREWDVIVADYFLPELNALDALRRVQRSGRDIPFIVISGSVGENVIVEIMKAGAHDYVMKGNLTRLVPAIEREVRETSGRAARARAEAALKETEALGRAVLDSLSAEISVLDEHGNIISVNRAWEEFAKSTHPDGESTFLGSNYLETCRNAAPDSPEAAEAHAGIQSVLQGKLPSFVLEYSCTFAGVERWFVLNARPLSGRGGAVVSHIDITERKKAEQEIHLLAQALRCISDCVWLTGLDARIVFVNQAFVNTYGYSMEDVEMRPIEILNSPGNAPALLEAFWPATLAGGWKGELLNRRKDGSEFPVALSTALIRDKRRRPIACIGVASDISQRKQAEEALRESEARFRAVVESLAEGLLLTDLQDVVLYANSRIAELTGYTAAELIGRPAYELLLRPEEWPAALKRYERRRQGQAERYEVELICKGGGSCWTEVSAAPLRDVQGRIVGTVGAITDITERRQAREAIERSESGLVLAQRIGHVGSWESDSGKRQLDWSAETFRIFGYEPGQIAPSNAVFLQAIHPDDRDRVKQATERAWRDGQRYSVDHRIIRPDGSERIVHEQAELVWDRDGKVIRMVGTVQDITERKRLEEQLRQSQKMEAVGQLAGGIAHDFNNILTVIHGFAELIQENIRIDPETRAYVTQIGQSAARASKLTRQLLAFGRKQVIQLRDLSLHDLLQSLSTMLQRLVGEHIVLDLQSSPKLPLVQADAGMMEQILINLALNARDAMPDGGRLTIRANSEAISSAQCRVGDEAAPGDFVCLEVIDTGCGMTPETLARVFEPFFTTKDVGKGTGLGLSTVYGIVKQHGGWIQVVSELRKGASFRLFFPISSTPVAASGTASLQSPVPGGSETVLIVEDEAALRALAATTLRRYGYEILEASSGPEALRLWQSGTHRIDLLLTDMVMPGGMSGRELGAMLCQKQPSLRVLYSSGYSIDFGQKDFPLEEGANFVSKPYTSETLARAVRTCLDQPPRR